MFSVEKDCVTKARNIQHQGEIDERARDREREREREKKKKKKKKAGRRAAEEFLRIAGEIGRRISVFENFI